MWRRALCVIVVAAGAALPGTAAAAPPAPWPSASDIRTADPGIAKDDAACMVAYLHGRLARGDLLAPYTSRTPAQKRVRTAARAHCMTRAERNASVRRDFERVLGKHSQLTCVAREIEGRSWAVRIALTTRAAELRMYDRVFRKCRFMGVYYDTLGRSLQLTLTSAERGCANRAGSVVPLYAGRTDDDDLSPDALKSAADVYDRCVGRASEAAMWRRSLAGDVRPGPITCVARQLTASVSFGMLFVDRAGWPARRASVLHVRRQRAATRTGAGARRSVSAAGPA